MRNLQQIFGCLALLTACSKPTPQPNVSVMLHVTPPRFACNDATVVALGSEGEGGYRFACEATGESLEVVYASRDGALEISALTLGAPETQDFVLARDHAQLAARGLPPCQDAQSIDPSFRAAPLPKEGTHLAYGSHPVRLAHPCGEAVLQLGRVPSSP